MSKLVVVSPHLDDAVLSLGSHILSWVCNDEQIEVVSVFSRLSETYPSYSEKYMLDSGYNDWKKFEIARGIEDRMAMEQLGVKWKHLGLIDAGFRSSNYKKLYSDQTVLFSGNVIEGDEIENKLKRKLGKVLYGGSRVYCPLGVGGHVDHVAVRRVIDDLYSRDLVHYYLDLPYGYQRRNWRQTVMVLQKYRVLSVKCSSRNKMDLLQKYRSQAEFFQRVRWYPEVLFT